MKQNSQDAVFRLIALSYVETAGEGLIKEHAQLEAQNTRYLTPKMDRVISEKVYGTAGRSRPSRLRTAAALAAAVAVAVLVFPQWNTPQQKISDTNPRSQVVAADEADVEIAENALTAEDAAAAEEPVQETMPEAFLQMAEYQVIPLGFELPDSFTLSGVEQDNALSIYYLSDQKLDNVVLTLAYEGDIPARDLPYTQVMIGEYPVSAVSDADYQLMTFAKDGLRYTLTCRYDINTLADLSAAIIF